MLAPGHYNFAWTIVVRPKGNGYSVTEETAREFGQDGKLTQIVDANAQWVRDFQSGKAQIDTIADALYRPEFILEVEA